MKFLHVTMPDNSVWKLDINIIAEDRAEYYSEFKGEDYDKVLSETLTDHEELIDWAENNMDWNNIEGKAIKVRDGEVDYEDGWCNGDKIIKEE